MQRLYLGQKYLLINIIKKNPSEMQHKGSSPGIVNLQCQDTVYHGIFTDTLTAVK